MAAAAGQDHTVLLTSEGTASDIPNLVAGQTYTQVAAGRDQTVLLTSEGTAVACGWNGDGQCDIPELVAGQIYTQVATGHLHTVLLTSGGTAVAGGNNRDGQCNIPDLAAGQTYAALDMRALLLQAWLDGDSIRFVALGGVERYRVAAAHSSCIAGVRDQLMSGCRAGRFGPGVTRVDAVLPDGRLLSDVAAEETVASAFGLAAPACAASDGHSSEHSV
ncbi:unnamed protein product [Prorocentrum cordatum]|uniref:Uncharacterized protein n=1 Tax=Prorocentrum cordatum TaxID=2364126 RepID=A0ABN9R173_9DINO|nr:unnamed protein product [Polarella glacialis]